MFDGVDLCMSTTILMLSPFLHRSADFYETLLETAAETAFSIVFKNVN